MTALAGASRRPALRVALALALALALGVVMLAMLVGLTLHEGLDLEPLPPPWSRLSGWAAGLLAGLGGSGAVLLAWALRQRAQRSRRVRPGSAAGGEPLLAALMPLVERTTRSLRATRGDLCTEIGPGVAPLHLPPAMVLGLTRLTQDALDDARRQSEGSGRLRLELDLQHGETGWHLRLTVIDPEPTPPPDAAPGAVSLHRRAVASMQRQATALGAQLDIGHDERGTCVEWVLALPAEPVTAGR